MKQASIDQGSAAGATQGGARMRARNLRTALILASVAAVFFAGVVAKHWLFPVQ